MLSLPSSEWQLFSAARTPFLTESLLCELILTQSNVLKHTIAIDVVMHARPLLSEMRYERIGLSVSNVILHLHYSDKKKYSVWHSYFHPFNVSSKVKKVKKVYKVKRGRGFLLQVWPPGRLGQQRGLLQLCSSGWRHCFVLIGPETLLPRSHKFLDISLSSTFRLKILASSFTMFLGTMMKNNVNEDAKIK